MKKHFILILTTLFLFAYCGKKKTQETSSTTETATTEMAVNEAGKSVYMTNCASCHGPQGAGDGAAAAALNPKPRNFQTEELAYGSDLASVIKVVTNGSPKVPTMVAWKSVLNEQQIKDVSEYVLYLVKKGK